MSRILVLGGYGGFGGRISHRLAVAGHQVLVAGRSRQRAAAFCRDVGGLKPIEVDRNDIEAAIAQHQPDVVVDASGPFQAMDYAVPRACISAHVHYLDIADGRDFVCGIESLHVTAEAEGVVIVSGASSVPALSGAVVRHLASGMAKVDAIEMAISASNRAAAGPSVAASILSQTGQPLRVWLGQRWRSRFGWQGVTRETFTIEGQRNVPQRLVGLVDVPDLELLPERLPGRPSVLFRAGTELTFQNLALWLASWFVRWRVVRSLTPFARVLRSLQQLTARMGTDRSAMVVRVFGRVDGARIERRWTLIADQGDGPEIPTLSIVPLVAQILDGRACPGARDAGLMMTLKDYQPAFDALSIKHETVSRLVEPPLHRRVMGERFEALPSAVRAMHDVLRDGGAAGSATVTGAGNWVGGLVARVVGFPRAGTYDAEVHFAERDGIEIWTRSFGENRFTSELSQRGELLVERFGPLRFAFALASEPNGLAMIMQRWSLGPLRLPLALAPRSKAREWEEDDLFHFDVPIALPIVGKLVHYRGWLRRLDG